MASIFLRGPIAAGASLLCGRYLLLMRSGYLVSMAAQIGPRAAWSRWIDHEPPSAEADSFGLDGARGNSLSPAIA